MLGRTSGLLRLISALVFYLLFAMVFPVEPLFGLINLLLATSCLFLVFCASRAPYSLVQTFGVSSFILLSVMPRIESNMGVAYWGGSASVLQYYSLTSMLSLFGIVLFWASWSLQQRRSLLVARRQTGEVSGARAIFVSAAVFLIILAYNGFSFSNIWFRGVGEDLGRIALLQTSWLIFSYFLYPVPSVVLVLYLVSGRRSYIVLGILFVFVILGNPPTGMPRFQSGMIYIAIIISCWPQLAAKPYFITWSVFAGLFGILPVFDAFRYHTSNVSVNYGFDWILEGHFDSMQNFARVVENEFITWGWQLLGVVGFFVPRAIWSSKPIGSGHEIADINNLELSNISMNFFGEGYVNFGMFGVIIFAIILGLIFGRLDAAFWRGRYKDRALGVIYLFLIGGTFFLVRGDLMSSFAYIMGMIASVIVLRKLLTRRVAAIVTRTGSKLRA